MSKYFNNKWDRRKFLKTCSAAGLGTLLSTYPNTLFSSQNKKFFNGTADRVILLWMAGGMAHTETFDPKPMLEYSKGVRSNFIRSTFPTIDTSVDNIKFSKGLENIAKIIDKGTVIRSFSPPDLGHVLHARHQYHFHTGYAPPLTVNAPHIGSVISKSLGSINDQMPSFVHIGQRLNIDGSPEVKAFLTPGFLGFEYAPLLVPFPSDAKKIIKPIIDNSRFINRNKLYKDLLKNSPIGEFGSDYQKESLLRAFDNSHRIISSESSKAFDLSLEPKKTYDYYNTGRFGLGCLLAKRLVKEGVRFVEVTSEHVPFGNWDTHENGHTKTKDMKKLIDRPVSQLIKDLDESGLLKNTLVILASEFSRTTALDPSGIHKDNQKYILKKKSQYGLHKHFIKAGSVLMFGGGAKKGFVYGKSSDQVPCPTIENPVIVEDLHATIFHALGIPADLSYEVERRPFYVTKDGKGKLIKDLLV